MKYVIVYAIMITTISPVVFKIDIVDNKIVTRIQTEKLDSVKVNNLDEVNKFLDKLTPQVKIKKIKTVAK